MSWRLITFLRHIVDVFSISGRGTVATGRVERGVVNKGDEVEIVGYGSKMKTTLTGIGTLIRISRPYTRVLT